MYQIVLFLNVGVLVEKNFVTSQQIGELVVDELDELLENELHINDVIDTLEQKLLEVIDEMRIEELDAPQVD